MGRVTIEETTIDPSRTEPNPRKTMRQQLNDMFEELYGGVGESEAITASADGSTSVISDTTKFAIVTSSDANHIVVLPTPTPGKEVLISVGSNGFELRSDTPASVAINGGSGANAESAIAANSLLRAVCESATAWKVMKIGSMPVAQVAGTLTGTVDGTIADVAAIALSTTNTYTDAAVNSAVNTAITSVNLQLKELQTQLNAVIAALSVEAAA